jgi:hypothetical protein
MFRNGKSSEEKEDCPEIICRNDPYQKYRKLASFINVDELKQDENKLEEECPLNK